MSNTEKEDIVNALYKKYKPVVTFCVSFFVVSVTSTWWVAHNVATASDIDKLNIKIDAVSDKIQNVVSTEQAANAHKEINGRIDSLDKHKISFNDLKAQASKRGNRGDLRGVTARKDEYGNTTYTPIY